LLAVLGLAGLVSLGLTAAGTAITDQLVRALGLTHVSGMHAVLSAAGLALAVSGDLVIAWWLIVRLPDAHPRRAVAIRASVLAAVGFEVLKVVGTITIARTAHSPTAGPFAGVVAILVWLQLVSRLLLFCVAFAATDPRSTVPVGTGSSVPVGTAVDEDARGDEEHAGDGQPEPETVPRPAAGERC
jgi:membrane protein